MTDKVGDAQTGSEIEVTDATSFGDVINQVHGLHCAVISSLIDLVAVAKDSELLVDDGYPITQWLVARLGVSQGFARDIVSAGEVLGDLPLVREQFSLGVISWDKVRVLVGFVDSSEDGLWADKARWWTVSQLKTEAARRRRIAENEARAAESARSFKWRWNEDKTVAYLSGRLPSASASQVITAISRLVDQDQTSKDQREFYEARCADALVELASMRLADDSDGDRACVVVHIDLESAKNAVLSDGGVVPKAVMDRITCDSHLQVVIQDESGNALGIGRKSRVIPHWLGRQVKFRDQGCRFTGCGRTRWTHAHHIEHWEDGGRTDGTAPKLVDS